MLIPYDNPSKLNNDHIILIDHLLAKLKFTSDALLPEDILNSFIIYNYLDKHLLDCLIKDKINIKKIIYKAIQNYLIACDDSAILQLFEESKSSCQYMIFWELISAYNLLHKLSDLILLKIFTKYNQDSYIDLFHNKISNSLKEHIQGFLLRNVQAFELLEYYVLSGKFINIDKSILNRIALAYLHLPSKRSSLVYGLIYSKLPFSAEVRFFAAKLLNQFKDLPYTQSLRQLEPRFTTFDQAYIDKIQAESIESIGNVKIYGYPLNAETPCGIKYLFFVDIDISSLLSNPSIEKTYFTLKDLLNIFKIYNISFFQEIEDREDAIINKYYDIIFTRNTKSSFIKLIEAFIMALPDNNQLEDVFEWFFKKYLKNQYNIDNFIFNKIDHKLDLHHKISLLCIEIEKILRQYNHYVIYKSIDHDLIRYDNSSPLYSEIKSLLENKYFYVDHNFSCHKSLSDINLILIFTLTYNQFNSGVTSDNISFEEFFLSKNLKITDISEKNSKLFHDCIDYGLLFIDQDGYIRPNSSVIRILHEHDLKQIIKEPISYYDHDEPTKIDLLKLKNCPHWTQESTLLTRSEQKYFSFVLRNNIYPDGLNIRNRYIHAFDIPDAETIHKDYLHVLSVMIILIIRIDEDLNFFKSLQSS